MLDEGDIFGINGSFGAAKKTFPLILVKQRQNFVWVCTTMVIIVICLLTDKII